MSNLIFVTVLNPLCPYDLHFSNVMPPGVQTDAENETWSFGGGLFDIGSSVRTSNGNEILEGILFVYDPGNYLHREKMLEIQEDLKTHGQLVIA